MPESRDVTEGWEESWAQSFEEGFYDNLDGAEEKQALLVEVDAQGNSKVVGVAKGAEAEKLIDEAKQNEIAVYQDAAGVESLLQGVERSTDVPGEVYELISAMIGFAQDLDSEWCAQKLPAAVASLPGSLEVEFGHEDI